MGESLGGGEGEKKVIALLSNVTVDLLVAQLRREYSVVTPNGFNTWVQAALDTDSSLYVQPVDAFLVLVDGTEMASADDDSWAVRLGEWEMALNTVVTNFPNVPVIVSTLDVCDNSPKALAELGRGPSVERAWDEILGRLAEAHQNLYFLDVRQLACDLGRRNFYSRKMWYLASMPWSRDGLSALRDKIREALGTVFVQRRKVLVVDLDNTLWGGVIGEDGVEGISLASHGAGQQYRDFQDALHQMSRNGVLLAIVSKNNEEDVANAFAAHPDMVLSIDDFVTTRINWRSKAENIIDISEELNITLGGFVFVDDNPAERAEVAARCPDVLVAPFPADSSELPALACSLWENEFRPPRVLKEDAEKVSMYKAERERAQVRKSAGDVSDYLRQLRMEADFHEMRPDEEERVAQLVGKSNQFNLTTRRHTKAEIHSFSSDPKSHVIVGYMNDAYGSSGLVAVLVAVEEEDRVRIDTLLMSCRVMGRRFEELLVASLMESLPADAFVVGEYIATKKNAPVSDFYGKLGFAELSGDEEHKWYGLRAADYASNAADVYGAVSLA